MPQAVVQEQEQLAVLAVQVVVLLAVVQEQVLQVQQVVVRQAQVPVLVQRVFVLWCRPKHLQKIPYRPQ